MPDESAPLGPPIVLCPLEAERQAVRAALDRAGLVRIAARWTGIGANAAASAVMNLERRPSLVVMAGICGGLADCPDVITVTRVVDERGRSWESPCAGHDGVTIAGVDRLISTPAQKRLLHAATGAVAVDMESHGFAQACDEWGDDAVVGADRQGPLRWAVVRGVSDPHNESIPEQLVRWFDVKGGLIAARVAADLARRPWLLPSLVRLGRRSRRVLPRVGERVAALVRAAVQEVAAEEIAAAGTGRA